MILENKYPTSFHLLTFEKNRKWKLAAADRSVERTHNDHFPHPNSIQENQKKKKQKTGKTGKSSTTTTITYTTSGLNKSFIKQFLSPTLHRSSRVENNYAPLEGG